MLILHHQQTHYVIIKYQELLMVVWEQFIVVLKLSIQDSINISLTYHQYYNLAKLLVVLMFGLILRLLVYVPSI